MSKESGCFQPLAIFSYLLTLLGCLAFATPVQASDLALEEVDCRCCHGASLADRHHLLVPESGLECLQCHALNFNDSSLQYDVAVIRDPPTQNTSIATVTGRVSDQNGQGLAWATVTAENGSSALTSETGDYQLTNIPATGHTLVATLNGYSSEPQTLMVVAPLTSAVDFVLAPLPAEICGDRLDNDSDGLIDCLDSDCSTAGDCGSVAKEDCSDGRDNNSDGLIDCEDSACNTTSICLAPPVEICLDGFDNDGDGQIDCADDKCASFSACLPPSVVENCRNTIDDDNDGQIDCADNECIADQSCAGATLVEFCSNSFDDDNDGLTGCQDPDCQEESHCQGSPVLEICDNEIDDNGDGRIDCRDRQCKKEFAYCKRRYAFGKLKQLSVLKERSLGEKQRHPYRVHWKKYQRSALLKILKRQDKLNIPPQ